jgi:hypothetical protein
MGTRQLYTLHYLLLKNGLRSRILWRTCVYIEVEFRTGSDALGLLSKAFTDIMNTDKLNDLPLPENIQIDSKYNEYVPNSLLKKSHINDFLDLEGLKEILKEHLL